MPAVWQRDEAESQRRAWGRHLNLRALQARKGQETGEATWLSNSTPKRDHLHCGADHLPHVDNRRPGGRVGAQGVAHEAGRYEKSSLFTAAHSKCTPSFPAIGSHPRTLPDARHRGPPRQTATLDRFRRATRPFGRHSEASGSRRPSVARRNVVSSPVRRTYLPRNSPNGCSGSMCSQKILNATSSGTASTAGRYPRFSPIA